jgi:hypothetical protein
VRVTGSARPVGSRAVLERLTGHLLRERNWAFPPEDFNQQEPFEFDIEACLRRRRPATVIRTLAIRSGERLDDPGARAPGHRDAQREALYVISIIFSRTA